VLELVSCKIFGTRHCRCATCQ